MIIWKIIKSVVGGAIGLLLLGVTLCYTYGMVLALGWELVTWTAQVVLAAIYGILAMAIVVAAKDYICGKAESPEMERKLGIGMKVLLLIVFIAFSSIEYYTFSWMRTEWNKNSYVIYVHNGCKYDIEKVETYVDFKYNSGEKTFTIHPKKDSAYVINLSEDTLALYEWGGERMLKILAPHRQIICGKMDNLDLFEKDPDVKQSPKRRILKLKE